MINQFKTILLIPLLVLTTGFFAQYINIEITTPYIEEITPSFYYENDTIIGIGISIDTSQKNNGTSSLQFKKFDSNYSSVQNNLFNDTVYYHYIYNSIQHQNFYYTVGTQHVKQNYDTLIGTLNKFNNQGELIWSKKYTDSISINHLGHIKPINDTLLIICGNTNYNGTSTFTSLIDTSGNIIWHKFDSIPGKNFNVMNISVVNGKLYQAFYQSLSDTYPMLRCSNPLNGNVYWTKTYVLPNDNAYLYISQMPDGSLLGSGDYKADSAFPYKPYLVHLDTAGNILYDTVIQNNFSTYNSLLGIWYHPTVLFDSTAFYVVGIKTYPNYSAVMVLYKIDYNFNILWQREYESGRPNAGYTNIYSIFKKGSNSILMAGNKSAETGYNTNDVWFMEVDTNGCLIANCTVGINELNFKQNVEVFPNPTNNAITITLNDEVTADEIRITDIQGRVIYDSRISNSKIYFEFYQYEQGIYLVQLFNKGIPLKTSKVVVRK